METVKPPYKKGAHTTPVISPEEAERLYGVKPDVKPVKMTAPKPEPIPKPPKKANGRPQIEINPEAVRALASSFCTNEEIAARIGVSVKTLFKAARIRTAEDVDEGKTNPSPNVETPVGIALRDGRNFAKASLRAKQYAMAMSGNVPLLIHLGKHELGQVDNVHLDLDREIATLLSKVANIRETSACSGVEGDN